MNFVADENLDAAIVERLRQDGHTIWYVAELDRGISDAAVDKLKMTGRRSRVCQSRQIFAPVLHYNTDLA